MVLSEFTTTRDNTGVIVCTKKSPTVQEAPTMAVLMIAMRNVTCAAGAKDIIE